MDLMVFRRKGEQDWSNKQMDECKQRVYALGARAVMQQVKKDEEDYNAWEDGRKIPEERKAELSSDCPGHVHQLVMLWDALQGVDKALGSRNEGGPKRTAAA